MCVLHTIFYTLQVFIQGFGRNAGPCSHIFPRDPWKKVLPHCHHTNYLEKVTSTDVLTIALHQPKCNTETLVQLQGGFKVPREMGKCALPFPIRISRKGTTVTRRHPGDCLSYFQPWKCKRAELAHYSQLRKEIESCISKRKETLQSYFASTISVIKKAIFRWKRVILTLYILRKKNHTTKKILRSFLNFTI